MTAAGPSALRRTPNASASSRSRARRSARSSTSCRATRSSLPPKNSKTSRSGRLLGEAAREGGKGGGRGRGADGGRGRGHTAAGVLFDLNELMLVGATHDFLSGLVELGTTRAAVVPVFLEAVAHLVNAGRPLDISDEKLLYTVPPSKAATGEPSAPVVPAGQHLALHSTAIQLGVEAMLRSEGGDPFNEDALYYIPHVACVTGPDQPPTPGGAYVPYVMPLLPGDPPPTVMDDLVGGTN